MRAAVLLAGLLVGCSRSSAPPPPSAPSSSAPPAFEVAYREPADVFEIVDNVSRWLPEKNEPEYRDAWDARGLGAPGDDALFAAYARVRSRSYPPEAEGDVLVLGHAKAPDRFAEAFYRATTLEAAYAELATFLPRDDVAVVRRVHDTLRPRLAPLLEESRAYASLASRLEARLRDPAVSRFAAKLRAFHGATDTSPLTVLLVWWPDVESTRGAKRGSFVLVRAHPVAHAKEAVEPAVPIHELAHDVASHAPDAAKRARAATFLAGCPRPPGVRAVALLEEPLAVAEQKVFVRDVAPDEVDFSRSWYGDPWVSTFAKLLYAPVARALDEGRALDETAMRRAARTCAELARTAKSVAP